MSRRTTRSTPLRAATGITEFLYPYYRVASALDPIVHASAVCTNLVAPVDHPLQYVECSPPPAALRSMSCFVSRRARSRLICFAPPVNHSRHAMPASPPPSSSASYGGKRNSTLSSPP